MGNSYRPMTPEEVRALMHSHGYEMAWRSGDNTALCFKKEEDNLLLSCRVTVDPHNEGHWTFSMALMPGVQMLVELHTTGNAQFPHPKFHRFERTMLKFARACAAVADLPAV